MRSSALWVCHLVPVKATSTRHPPEHRHIVWWQLPKQYVDAQAGGGLTWPLLAPNGTPTAPSYAFSSATNTGMYAPSSLTIGFATNGVGRWTINNVGHLLATTDTTFDIGTSTSGKPRDVYVGGSLYTGMAGTGATVYFGNLTRWLQFDTTSSQFRFSEPVGSAIAAQVAGPLRLAAAPVVNMDAATKQYVDSALS